jgi:hypothetical protein
MAVGKWTGNTKIEELMVGWLIMFGAGVVIIAGAQYGIDQTIKTAPLMDQLLDSTNSTGSTISDLNREGTGYWLALLLWLQRAGIGVTIIGVILLSVQKNTNLERK